jgi:hypothetical protein
MKRREFITLLERRCGVMAPRGARAKPERLRHIALVPGAANDPVWQARIGAFQQALGSSAAMCGSTSAGPHKNIQHTVRYTELAPDRFKDFWR